MDLFEAGAGGVFTGESLLDGIVVAKSTPFTRPDIRSGEHTLLARSAGFRDKTYRFKADASEPAIINIELEPDGAGSKASPAPSTRAAALGPKMEPVGYLTVKASGVKVAKVLVDGRDAGTSPLVAFKVTTGRHSITVVEQADGQPGRSKTLDVNVAPTHTRQDPLRLVVPM